MKTVGKAFEVALRIRLNQVKSVARDSFERDAWAFGLADQETRNLIGHFEKPLSDADIDHDHTRRELRRYAKGRQRCTAGRLRQSAFRKAKFGKSLGRHQRFSGRRDEGLQTSSSNRR